tara:strand:- start:150 stop:2441 length:2292 start_codon:yes stop_codon:yes gene_type:complete
VGQLTKILFGDSNISETALSEREMALAVMNPEPLDALLGTNYTDPVAKEIGLDVYDEMYATDAQVRACHHMKIMGRLMTGWEFLPGRGNPKHAEFVEYAFENMDGGVHNFLRDLMEALKYGFSIVEIVWERYTDGPWKGHLGIKALKPKPAISFKLKVDSRGNLRKRGVMQETASGKLLKYPKDKFIIFTYQKEPTGFYGRSDFQPIYRNYFIKKALEKWWAAYLEKFAAPTAIGKYPPGASQTEKKEVLDFLRKMQGNSAAVVPEKWGMELLQASPGGSENFLKAIAYQNKMIARGTLVPDLIQDQGDRSGSYSLGQVHANNFLWVLQGLGNELETVVKEQLIRKLIDVNFSSVSAYPEFKFMEFAPADQKAVADMFLGLVNGGIMDPNEEVIRRRLNLPAGGTARTEPRSDGSPESSQTLPNQAQSADPPASYTEGLKVEEEHSSTIHNDHAHHISVSTEGNGTAAPVAHEHLIVNGEIQPIHGHTHDIILGVGHTGIGGGHAHPVRGNKAVAVSHSHEVANWKVWASGDHAHDFGSRAERSSVDESAIKAPGRLDTDDGGGGGPPKDPPFQHSEDLPDAVFAFDPDDLVREHYESAKSQIHSGLVEAGGDLKNIKIRQLSRFKESLRKFLTEQMIRGGVACMVGEEGDSPVELPDVPENLDKDFLEMAEVYGGVLSLYEDEIPAVDELCYSLTGKMGEMIRESVLEARLAEARGFSISDTLGDFLSNTQWEDSALRDVSRAAVAINATGERKMKAWLKHH